MASVLYRYGTQDQYNAVAQKDENAIYFISDTQRIYKGNKLYASADIIVSPTVPEFETALADKLYVVFVDGEVTLYFKGESAMLVAGGGKVRPGSISDLNSFDPALLDTATSEELANSKLPTTSKVSEMISAAVGEYDGAFTDVTAAPAEGASGTVLTFTKKSGGTKQVTIADLFLSAASYDPVSHILTLTVSGQEEPVTVDLAALVPQAVSTADVAMADNIVVTVDVGNFKKGDTISKTETADLQTLLLNMLSQDSNPTATQPSANITLTGAGNVEVGTTFTPSFTASLNPGKYVANGKEQASGVTASTYAFTDSKNRSIAAGSSASGTFEAFQVADGENYTVTVTVAHTAGDVPKTFLGKDYAAAQIKAGNKTKVSSAVKGFRRTFSGALTSKAGEVNSALVRGLPNKSVAASSPGASFNVSVPVGTQRVVVAYPATLRDVSSITSAEEFGSEIKDSFTLMTVPVAGAAAGTEINYKVYVKDLAAPQASATTYTVKI